jgi:3-oxoacyl-[acyl-carrier protein] reductase
VTVLDKLRLDGRLAVVTGGSRGIGLAIARGFAEAGARVVIASRDGERCAQVAGTLPGDAVGVACDVASPEAVHALMDRAELLGGTDVFVHCAGLAASAKALSTPREQLVQMLELHFLGGVQGAQRAAQQMLAHERGGAVLLVSSVWGLGGNATTLAYGSAKAALAHAVKVMAIEWARHGVRVNGLAPGFVETEMTAHLEGPVRDKLLSRVPFRRMAEPHEMAGPALFLCSEAASYVTGQTLVVDGGERAR